MVPEPAEMAISLPPAPDASFASDNAAGAVPEVIEAVARANEGPALAYGDDPWTRQAEQALRATFDAPVESLLCWGGTGANVVGLGTLLSPWEAVVCADSAHIVVDECGAPVRFTGSSLLPVATSDGKLRPADLDRWREWQGSEHHPQPRVVSVTQSSEMGTVYTADELGALCEAAHAAGMLVHLDGARIANAVAALDTDLPTLVRDTGVDVMTFGFTKNGALGAEAVVFLRPELAGPARFVRKQAGQLVSKTRFVAAQVLALLDDDRWLAQARHANAAAARLAAGLEGVPGVELVGSPEVNAVFARVPPAAVAPLQAWSFFWVWDEAASLVRFMTSFATTDEDVDRFAAGVAAIVAPHA